MVGVVMESRDRARRVGDGSEEAQSNCDLSIGYPTPASLLFFRAFFVAVGHCRLPLSVSVSRQCASVLLGDELSLPQRVSRQIALPIVAHEKTRGRVSLPNCNASVPLQPLVRVEPLFRWRASPGVSAWHLFGSRCREASEGTDKGDKHGHE